MVYFNATGYFQQNGCFCPLRVPSSSNINKHWEAELEALKGNNAKLTAALLESTANVKQWKQQLAAYQEEAERLHKRVRLRAARGEPADHLTARLTEARCLCVCVCPR